MKGRQAWVYPLVTVAVLLALWQWVVGAGWLADWLLPSPWQVLQALGQKGGMLAQHGLVTLAEAGMGLFCSVLLALLFALWMTLMPVVKRCLYPLLLGSQMVPIVVLAPLFLIWFGFGMLPKVLVVILICFFPMVVNILAGLNALDRDMLVFYQSLGAKPGRLFRLVRLPAALPYFFGGLRVSATYSIMGAVIGEWLGASRGIGLLLTRAQRAFDLPLVFAAIVVIILLSAGVFGLVCLAERRCLRWMRPTQEADWQTMTPVITEEVASYGDKPAGEKMEEKKEE